MYTDSKFAAHMDSIYEFVKNARDEYYSRTIEVVPGYEFSQHETLRTIELYSNSKFLTSNKDSLGREKPFFNICKFRVNVAVQATVQARLNEQLNSYKISRSKSEALLVGRIFDDRGNRMTPSHARKNGTKYRYYISSVLVQGQGEQAGTVNRIQAADVEARIIKAVRRHTDADNDLDDRKLINERVIRIEVQAHKLVVELAKARAAGSRQRARRIVIDIPWSKPPSKRRREILIPQSQNSENIRPIRSENRALLVTTAIARGRRWLDELIANTSRGLF